MSERFRNWGIVVGLALVAGAVLVVSLNPRVPPGVNPVGGDADQPGSMANRTMNDWKVEPTLELPSGRFPLIRKDANVHVASVVEAIETGKFPERLSPLVAPAPFDREAFQKDPASYLNIVEPGRVWQVAQPGAGVPHIKMRTQYLSTIQQGETVS